MVREVIQKVTEKEYRLISPLLSDGSTKTQVRWVECDELKALGHGVVFFHDEVRGERGRRPVAFLEGFEWLQRQGGNPATVSLITKSPCSFSTDHWSRIMESTRDAVLVFLSNDGNPHWSFRHGPISIGING